MFGAIANGESLVRMPLLGEDCMSTLECLGQMGLRWEEAAGHEFRLMPAAEWNQPATVLDCGNSGTTMRLMSGLVASRPLIVTMIGDSSLSRRPMKRIAEPLRLMGAKVVGDTPPLEITGAALHGIDFSSPVASGQIKSCVLLAGLRASGVTRVTEPALSRDHTERMLAATGVSLVRDGLSVSVEGGQTVGAFEFTVPADISSSAFAACLCALHPGSELTIRDLGLNPSRTGLLDVLAQVGATLEMTPKADQLGEPFGDVYVKGPQLLKPFEISGDLVPRLIDEIPVLAVLATQCHGTSIVKDAREMRVKETDRIEVMAAGLRRMGANIETFEDGMAITGPTPLIGIEIDAAEDHRIAMSFYVAGSIASGQTMISGADSIRTSYLGFEQQMRSIVIE